MKIMCGRWSMMIDSFVLINHVVHCTALSLAVPQGYQFSLHYSRPHLPLCSHYPFTPACDSVGRALTSSIQSCLVSTVTCAGLTPICSRSYWPRRLSWRQLDPRRWMRVCSATLSLAWTDAVSSWPKLTIQWRL